MLGRKIGRRRWSELFGLALIPLFGSCAFLLDFDELQSNAGDASAASGGMGGSAGSTSGDTGGSAGSTSGGTGATGGGAGISGAAGQDAGPTRVPLSELATELARAVCDNLRACFGPLTQIIIYDEPCEPYYRDFIEGHIIGPIELAIRNKGVSYDDTKGAECVAKLRAAAQSSPPDCASLDRFVEECKSTLGNLAAASAPCANSFECAIGLYCDFAEGCPGSCTPRGGEAAPCTENAQCSPGFVCAAESDDAGAKTCQAAIPAGQACAGNDDACAPGTMCIGGICQNVYDLFTLNTNQECWSNRLLCNPGLYCEFTGYPFLSFNGICKPEVGVGQPCLNALPDRCEPGTYCATPSGLPSTCVKLPTAGQACAQDTAQFVRLAPPCEPGLVCVGGRCLVRRRLGEPCTQSAECASTVCGPHPDGGTQVCLPASCPVALP